MSHSGELAPGDCSYFRFQAPHSGATARLSTRAVRPADRRTCSATKTSEAQRNWTDLRATCTSATSGTIGAVRRHERSHREDSTELRFSCQTLWRTTSFWGTVSYRWGKSSTYGESRESTRQVIWCSWSSDSTRICWTTSLVAEFKTRSSRNTSARRRSRTTCATPGSSNDTSRSVSPRHDHVTASVGPGCCDWQILRMIRPWPNGTRAKLQNKTCIGGWPNGTAKSSQLAWKPFNCLTTTAQSP